MSARERRGYGGSDDEKDDDDSRSSISRERDDGLGGGSSSGDSSSRNDDDDRSSSRDRDDDDDNDRAAGSFGRELGGDPVGDADRGTDDDSRSSISRERDDGLDGGSSSRDRNDDDDFRRDQQASQRVGGSGDPDDEPADSDTSLTGGDDRRRDQQASQRVGGSGDPTDPTEASQADGGSGRGGSAVVGGRSDSPVLEDRAVSALNERTETTLRTGDVTVDDGTASLTSAARLRERRAQAAEVFSDRLDRDIDPSDVVLDSGQARLEEQIADDVRQQREREARATLRSQAAEEFETNPDNIDIVEENGQLVARQDLSDDQLRINRLTGGRFESVVDLGRNTREAAAEPLDPVVEFGSETRSEALERFDGLTNRVGDAVNNARGGLETRVFTAGLSASGVDNRNAETSTDDLPDISAREAAALGAAGVAAPEPTTSVGGGIIAGGALLTLGAAELQRRRSQTPDAPAEEVSELDIPDEPTVDIGEISTPSRRVPVAGPELDAPSSRQSVSRAELETPDEPDAVQQSELDVEVDDDDRDVTIRTSEIQGLRQRQESDDESLTDLLDEELDRMQERGEPAVTPGGRVVREEVERVRREGGGVPSRFYDPSGEDFAISGGVGSEFINENRDPFDFVRSESPTQEDNADVESTESPLFDSAFPSLAESGYLPRVGSRSQATQGSLIGTDADELERQDQVEIENSLFESVNQARSNSLAEPTSLNTTSTATTSENIDQLFDNTFTDQSSSSRDRLRYDDDRRDDDDDGTTIDFGISDRVFGTGVADPGDVLDGFGSSSSGGSADAFDGVDDALEPFE